MNAKKIKKSTGLMSQTKPPSLFLSSQMTTAGSSNVFLSASEARIQDYEYLCAINTNVSNFVSVKLSGSHNYLLWKAQMVCLLDSKNMCGIVDSTFATPRFSGTEIMRQYDSLVRGWIFGSVTDDVLVDVIHLDSAKAAWDKLKSIHDPTDVRNKKKMEWSILPVRFPDNVWDAIDNLEYSDATVMKMIKTNAESCSITAALITAIAFAAGINIPDVSNKEMGISAFKEKIALFIFVISNAISLFASNTALLVFLSILASDFTERDKLQSLPRRLFIGIFSFFLCIAAMMVALSATLFRVFCDPNPWKLVMISGLLFIAIAFFVAVQSPLVVDLFKGTYLGIFGKQQKRHAVRDSNYYKNLREVTINGDWSEVESMLQKQELVTEQISRDGCTTLQLAAETGTKENDVGYNNAFNDDFNGDPVDVDEDGEAALSLGEKADQEEAICELLDIAKAGSSFQRMVFGYLPLAVPARRLDMVRPTVEQPVLNLLSRHKVEYVCLLVHNNCKSSTTYYTAASDFNRSTHNSHAKTLQVLNLANKGSNLRVFTVAELKTATVNFCTASKIGEGVFGSVYKGVIKSFDHRPMQVVVKLTNELLQGQKERETEINVPGVIEHPNLAKLIGYCAEDTEPGTQLLLVYEYMVNGTVRDHLSTKSETPLSWNMRLKVAQDVAQGLAYLHEQMEFQAEVNFIGRLSQPNLVKLLGYCDEGNELLLVYEFMQKGSLENHLFGRGSTVQPLPWDIRLKISIGAARGLAFLHTSEKQVIYRDFKLSNISLDASYNAKISDFGLAKVGPSATQSHVTTRVMGTYGYAAPEYVSTDRTTLVLGEGGFGWVHKGWLEDKSSSKSFVIAVKKLNSENMQGLQAWQAEVDFIGRLSQPNLVKLLGFCYHGNELLLVYEYMLKESLENHLFGKYAGERCQGDPERLWLTSCLMLFQKNLVGKGLSKDSKAHKLAFQHWIEAIDPRHRYGHSLHIYYKEWCKADAGQPFFYWLDVGDGKEIDLKECPRPKLRQQCIKYLGPQEREHYEYIIVEGKIMHCQTGLPLHTNNGEKWIFVMSTAKKLYAGERCAVIERKLSIAIPGNKIPSWFNETQPGYYIAMVLPPKCDTQINGIAVCGVFPGEWQGSHYLQRRCGIEPTNYNLLQKQLSKWMNQKQRTIQVPVSLFAIQMEIEGQ